ncbi:protein-disulfide reductase DsbD [Methylotuvimicrobium sp.]|uniref:protein-disulfide reductase DsbD n=1 Tax=Methylotuvimicrobium sp. TaxID=2822413 RepID=UPI003D6531D5
MPIKIILLCLIATFHQAAFAISESDLLPQEQAFKLTAKTNAKNEIVLTWQIADGYYLYRDKLGIESRSERITLDDITYPPGKTKHDEFFGDMVIYRNELTVEVPFIKLDNALNTLQLTVKHQGCADIGICYPPQKTALTVDLPPQDTSAKTGSIFGLVQGLSDLKLNLFQDELLPAEQAFRFFASVKDPNTLTVNWQIAEGYYLYRDKFQFDILDSEKVKIGNFTLPRGTPYHDEEFGDVEIFRNDLSFDLPINRYQADQQNIILQARFQGCADRGVCYPPMAQSTPLVLPMTASVSTPINSFTSTRIDQPQSEQDRIVQSLHQNTLWLTLLSFFGFGLLLSFTPCIFPMIPILSGIIVGQRNRVTTSRAFLLSLSYVTASALTYTVFGVLAALFGSNLQTTFQQPWIIALFSGIFVLLSLSMFGFYNLEMPASIQTRLHKSSDKHRDGSFWSAAIMGSLSSLIVGPCVAAPLAGALIYIGQTGDAVLGGIALFAMGFGMGVPLLILGASAGKLLPKAGQWLNATKAVFGVIMLAVALWMLDRILPPDITMFLWALLLIIPAIYLKAIDPLSENAGGWKKLWKGAGVVMLTYGVLLLIGLGMGNHNPLKPLQGLSLASTAEAESPLPFVKVASLQELENRIETAARNNQPVMLDFYADWCVSCKEMEAYTFMHPEVKQELNRFVLLKADVTENNFEHQALLKKFNLVGPPATLFFGADLTEKKHLRVIGYQDANAFLNILRQVDL